MAETTIVKKKRKKKQKPVLDEEVMDLDIDFEDDEDDAPKKKKRQKGTNSNTANVMQIVAKLVQIKDEMSAVLFEREDVITDLLRAVIAGENILLLGPPGTGKSMLAEIFFKHIGEANLFKWLMNRTTDPADIVGPYSVKAMENDRFLRVTTGKMPEAHGAFLDEIFKANEPALNNMLSMLNEGIFYNDGKAVPVELRVTIGASNEYPESDELEAFYDRFVFRHWVQYVQDPQNRIAMAVSSRDKNKNVLPPTMITLEEIDILQDFVSSVQFPDRLAKDYDRMYRALQKENINISDRRYVKGQRVMMANALLNGRTVAVGDDFKALRNVLWNKNVEEIDIVERELGKFVNPHESKIKELLKRAIEVESTTMSIENRTERAGEAVNASASLGDIIGKMEDEIEEASKNGVNTKDLEKIVTQVEDIMEKISTECLRKSSRPTKRAW